MRSSLIRRSAVAASAVSLALLVTACGGERTGGADGPLKDKAPAESSAPAAKALTAAELEKAVLADGDVAGYKVAKLGPDDITKKAVADKAECTPLAEVASGIAQGKPAATAQRKAVEEPKKNASASPEDALLGGLNVAIAFDSLHSYDGKGAEEALAAVKAAASACAGGFTTDADGEKTKVLKVEELKVSGGQEAAGWTLTADMEGTEMPVKVAVVRQGSTLASFIAFDFGAMATGQKDFPLPTAVIDAQVGKLAKLG